jgi:poly-gamma-glutamate capsule biosynthesis protein CapA/YwtB (metallophosphatase superfamily)
MNANNSDQKVPPNYFLANLESPLTDLITSSQVNLDNKLSLCADINQANLLESGGLFLVTLANNHRDDCAINGFSTTQKILSGMEVRFAGPELTPTYFNTENG